MDRRVLGRGDPAHREIRHRLAGGRRESGGDRPGDRGDPRGGARGRAADRRGSLRRWHFRSASGGWTIREWRGRWKLSRAHRARSGDDVRRGRCGTIVERIAGFVAAGASKFILRLAGGDDADLLDQTRRLIEEVLPAGGSALAEAGKAGGLTAGGSAHRSCRDAWRTRSPRQTGRATRRPRSTADAPSRSHVA